MGTKVVFEADLRTKNFSRGTETVEQGSQRMISAANRVQLAFRHFERGNFSQGFNNLGRAAGQVGTRFLELGSAATAAGRRIMSALEGGLSMLRSYVTYGSLVTGILGGLATKLTILDSAKFESEVGRAAILSQANPAQRAALLKHARDIGVETPFGPLAVAESMKVEAQRGRSADEIIALTEATKRFAVIANIDMKEAAETLSQVMFQFGIPMEKATETALKLANATTATALSGSEMFEALKFAGGAAGVFKVNLTEVLAVLGTLRRVTDPSMASTALRNVMLISSALSGKKPKMLKEIGLDEEDAKQFSFMSGQAKSLVDVISGLSKVFEKQPELALKAGFGNRTIIAFEQIAQKAKEAGGFFTQLEARINDTAIAEGQFNETIDLADNLFRRLETTAGAVFVAIGSKIRETFGIDQGVKALDDQIADLARNIAAIPKENVREIVDSLSAGLIQAFGTAVTFLIEALPPVAIAFGKLLFLGLREGFSQLTSDIGPHGAENKSYRNLYSAMSPDQRAAEAARLARALDLDKLTESGVAVRGFSMAHDPANVRRASEMLRILNSQSDADDAIRGATSGIRFAASNAAEHLGTNPSVMATKRALEAGEAARFKSENPLWPVATPGGFQNHGVILNYGSFSPAARAQPSRTSGSTPQERAQK